MIPGTRVYDVNTKYTGTLKTQPELPDNGGFRLVADVAWDNGTITTVYTSGIRAFADARRPVTVTDPAAGYDRALLAKARTLAATRTVRELQHLTGEITIDAAYASALGESQAIMAELVRHIERMTAEAARAQAAAITAESPDTLDAAGERLAREERWD